MPVRSSHCTSGGEVVDVELVKCLLLVGPPEDLGAVLGGGEHGGQPPIDHGQYPVGVLAGEVHVHVLRGDAAAVFQPSLINHAAWVWRRSWMHIFFDTRPTAQCTAGRK